MSCSGFLFNFSANIAFLHCDDGDVTTAPVMLVTASFDRLDLLKYPLGADQDLLMTGMLILHYYSTVKVSFVSSHQIDTVVLATRKVFQFLY